MNNNFANNMAANFNTGPIYNEKGGQIFHVDGKSYTVTLWCRRCHRSGHSPTDCTTILPLCHSCPNSRHIPENCPQTRGLPFQPRDLASYGLNLHVNDHGERKKIVKQQSLPQLRRHSRADDATASGAAPLINFEPSGNNENLDTSLAWNDHQENTLALRERGTASGNEAAQTADGHMSENDTSSEDLVCPTHALVHGCIDANCLFQISFD